MERRYTTKPVHQAYIEPHACVVSTTPDGQVQIWASSQGQFMIRAYCAKLLDIDMANIRVTPAEIGGGFGGKTLIYLEPVALVLSRKTGRAVKIVMTREEVFRATGPTSGGVIEVKLGAKRDGTIVAADLVLKYQAGAFPGSPVQPGCICAFAMYDLPNVNIVGYDVVSNRPKVAAYRAPRAPISSFGVESCLDELARELDIDPLVQREKNAAKEGTKAVHGPTWTNIGYLDTLAAAKAHPNYRIPLGPNQDRAPRLRLLVQCRGRIERPSARQRGRIGQRRLRQPGYRRLAPSMAMMAAGTLGIPVERVKPIVADTASIGFTHVTGGSRVTFATGMATVQATENVIDQLKRRAAMIWDISPEAVDWRDDSAYRAGANAGSFDPLPLADIAIKAARTGGPITAEVSVNAQGAGPAFATHICDVEVDPETGHVKVLRYTATQDVGRAIHPSYVEGQIQGGVAQGIGWALNEEYIYDKRGRLDNPGFLDYRVPVASDLPMIDAVIVEVPNPRHPFGVRGVGEVPIVPPMAAVANAIHAATGMRLRDLPMAPPKILAEIDTEEPRRLAAE
jgi:CO/xanthine dehydrogenase Mo-binding subunit